MGVIDVIYKSLRHLLHISQTYIDQLINAFCSVSGISKEVSSIQIQMIDSFVGSGIFVVVPAGVGFYWIISNLMSIGLLYILNYFIDPRKYIDNEQLESSKKKLEKMNQFKVQSGKRKIMNLYRLKNEIIDVL